MVFLNPAVLFGLIAAAIPVLLHFLNLQKLKRIEFSTLAFLKELQKTKIRKLKFKQWLLLALRVLLILLLVAAFARPTLETFTIAGTSSAKTSAVYIIDNSFSMSAVKGTGSHFNKAKEIVKNIINDFQQGDEAAVIFTTDVNEEKFSSAVSEFERELDNAGVSVKKQKFNRAVVNANTLLSSSNNFNKELFILSDFPQNELVNDDDEKNILLDENTKVYLFNFSNGELSNRSVTDFQLDNQLLEPGKTVSFTAQIKNVSGGAISNGIASLFINGIRSAQQSFDLNENESKLISFESVLSDAGLIQAYVEIEQDDILQDNIRYTAALVPEEINVLLASDSKDDTRFVKVALQSSSDKRETSIKEINLSELPYNLNSSYDVIIICGSKNINDVSVLNNFIEKGGRVILLPGSESKVNDFQLILAGLGIRANASQIGKPNSTESIAYFGKVEYEHPIFANLFEDRENTKVESPEVYSYFKIMPYSQTLPVISLNDNSLFLSEIKKGNGRLLLFNTSPVLSWNNFPIKSLFAPLINKSLLYQTMENESGKNVTAGDNIDIRINNLKLPQLKIVKPDATEEFVNLSELDNQNYFSYNKTDQLGIYQFYSGDELIDFASVNFDPDETNTAYANEDEIEKYISDFAPENNFTFIDPNENYKQSIKQARFGTELWKYFLIAALFVALLEMFVSKNAKKDFAGLKAG